jgi:1,4-alpha-glucan branching enzyme
VVAANLSGDILSEEKAYLYNQGTYFHAYNSLGAHVAELEGRQGVAFAVWAPAAVSVRVVGEFNRWGADGGYDMKRTPGGFWQTFVPGLGEGALYKYMLQTQNGETIYKADPFAFSAEKRPGTASKVANIEGYAWQDGAWLAKRRQISHFERPLNIYELHLGSWKRKEPSEDNSEGFLGYRELAAELPEYLRRMGYTHVEFLPVMEHPFDGSWGYQITGYFAPTSRYGSPKDFMYLVDSLHLEGIGVILDWVPGHFCKDAHGLAEFDGTALYEKELHDEWGTYKFNFERNEVRSFLISNALYWLDKYHIDGLRVDGVSSMLYLNYGVTDEAKKRYNPDGSEGNLPAVEFLRQMNGVVGKYFPDVFTVAEESTAWPLVTYPPAEGGLGFHYKWDMGWMNDTLRYMAIDFPGRVYRENHQLLTFSMMYAFNENFVLPLSHDEVVHGKCSLIGRMPGDYWRQFANLRLLYLYQMCHSGAKLNFMGNEIAQFIEWRFAEQIEWFLLEYEKHAQYQNYVAELNRLYLAERALWQNDYSWEGFSWLDADNAAQSVLYFRRQGKKTKDFLLVLLNFQPESYTEYEIGVPQGGLYKEIFSSDEQRFGGSGKVNVKPLRAVKKERHGQEYSIRIVVPPIGGVIIAKAQ